MGAYQPPEKYKNYLLPTSRPLRSHTFYKEKVWTLPEQIYKKLKKVTEFLESLYPELTDDFSINIKVVIEKNLELLIKDLNFLQNSLHNNPYSFNTNKLKTNQHHISEMKNVCDTLQTVRSYEHEFKKLGKIKHALHELEHLIQPSNFEISLEKAQAKSKPKPAPAKKEPIQLKAKKTTKAKSIVKPEKQKTVSKKTRLTTTPPKPIKIARKQPNKTKAPVHKLKQSEKKIAKPKLLAKSKKAVTAKPKLPAKNKKAVTAKSKLPAKNKKAATAKSKPKIKSSAEHKKK